MTASGDNSRPGWSESAYLKGLCFCNDPRDCWHGLCQVRRQLRFGMVLLENGAGHGLLAGRRQVGGKRPATVIGEADRTNGESPDRRRAGIARR